MKKILKVAILLSALFFLSKTSVFAAAKNDRCTWVADKGIIKYCAGGFSSPDDFKRSSVRLNCGGTVCNDFLLSVRSFFQGRSGVQNIPLSSIEVAKDTNGKYFGCFTGPFDSSFSTVIEDYSRRFNVDCRISKFGTPNIATGIVSIPVSLLDQAQAEKCEAETKKLTATLFGTLVDQNGQEVCTSELNLNTRVTDAHNANLSQLSSTFYVCNQIPDQKQKDKCLACAGNGDINAEVKGIWTAVGCIPTSQQGIIGSIIRIGLGLSGGFALLTMIAAGFMLSTSQGDPKKANEAKELMTSSVMGLLFIIFSVVILQFIGVTVLKIPGFGS